MLKQLIYAFGSEELILFIQEDIKGRVDEDQVLRPYFRHFKFKDEYGRRYTIEEHRHPNISYRLRKNDVTINMSWITHMLLKKYIKREHMG